jgi:hypothetical protein
MGISITSRNTPVLGDVSADPTRKEDSSSECIEMPLCFYER